LPPERQTEESDLSLIAETIRRRIWVVAVCLAVAVVGAIALTLTTEKQYASTSALLLRPSSGFEPQRVVETNLQLLSLPALAYQTAQEIPEMSAEEVTDAVVSSQQGESDIIRVKATTNDAERSADVANTFAEKFIEFRDRGTRGELTSKVQLVEKAEAEDSPVSPSPVKNVIFGALIGLALGIGLALLLEQLDRRVKRQDDLPEVTGLPLITTVPKRKAFDGEHLGDGSVSPAEAEIFLMLRANLRYFNVRKDIRSVLVTSAQPGEGKSLISLGLALGAAMSGERVLLIEADMRDPSLGAKLKVGAVQGLSWVLSDPNAKLVDAIATIPAKSLAETAGEAKMDFLPAGGIPPNPTELVDSQRMRDLLAEAEGSYDFVVVDTPPILVVADAIPLVSAVSGVLAVSGLGVSTRSSATDLAEQLERMDAATLGLVANFATHTGRSYEGYGYGRPPEASLMKTPAAKPAAAPKADPPPAPKAESGDNGADASSTASEPDPKESS
jgi:succinoglycan biosynthesis transport protein ExoP